ncbi:MAG: phosphate ABC transporter permease PstA [Gammaproteobacteria bacterium]|nr:MAG: phosphate ABC transporter permease PstA [Gammaproteobacteria bacterium]
MRDLKAFIRRQRRADHIFAVVGLLAMMVAVLTLLSLFINLLLDGIHRLRPDFFLNYPSRHPEKAGILSAWVGTIYVMVTTAFFAIPLGVSAGVYLEEYARRNWITDIIEINVTNLAAVPSIVYGLLALGLFVYQFDFGESILTAGLTLALLILPIIIVATRESIRAIPTAVREGAYALGATKWEVIWHHVIPYSGGGILTGIIIGLARAIGETAPVITIGALTFIAFLPPPPIQSHWPFISFEWLWSPFTVLPIQMFNWISRPQKAFLLNAAAAGVVLIVMTLAMNALAIYLRYRIRKRIHW